MVYLVTAYAVFWLGIFLLILRISMKEKHLQDEIAALREFLNRKGDGHDTR